MRNIIGRWLILAALLVVSSSPARALASKSLPPVQGAVDTTCSYSFRTSRGFNQPCVSESVISVSGGWSDATALRLCNSSSLRAYHVSGSSYITVTPSLGVVHEPYAVYVRIRVLPESLLVNGVKTNWYYGAGSRTIYIPAGRPTLLSLRVRYTRDTTYPGYQVEQGNSLKTIYVWVMRT